MEQIHLQSLCTMRNSFRGLFHSYKLLLISKLRRNKYSVCSVKSGSSLTLMLQFFIQWLMHPHILNSVNRVKKLLNFKTQDQHYRKQQKSISLPKLGVGFLLICTAVSFLLSSHVPYNHPDQYLFVHIMAFLLSTGFMYKIRFVEGKMLQICSSSSQRTRIWTEHVCRFKIWESLLGAIKQKQHQYCTYNSHQKTNM